MKILKQTLILILILAVVGISGCTNFTSNSTKHFDNGTIAFDYPNNLTINKTTDGIGLIDNSGNTFVYLGLALGSKEDFEKNWVTNPPSGTVVTPTTISGKKAYSIEGLYSGSYNYGTGVDLGDKYLVIITFVKNNTANPEESFEYKTYKMVIDSLKIN